jgi:hypothetical protein
MPVDLYNVVFTGELIPGSYPETVRQGLVNGDDWALEDCQPPTPIPPVLEIGHLRLEPLAEPTPRHDD